MYTLHLVAASITERWRTFFFDQMDSDRPIFDLRHGNLFDIKVRKIEYRIPFHGARSLVDGVETKTLERVII